MLARLTGVTITAADYPISRFHGGPPPISWKVDSARVFSLAEGTAAKLRGGGAKALNQPYRGRREYSIDPTADCGTAILA